MYFEQHDTPSSLIISIDRCSGNYEVFFTISGSRSDRDFHDNCLCVNVLCSI